MKSANSFFCLLQEFVYLGKFQPNMKLLKKLVALIGILFVILIAYLSFNALNFESKQIKVAALDAPQIDKAAIQNFSKALQIKTVSPENLADFDSLEFQKFTTFVSETYPLMDSLLEKKMLNSFSHLYHWKGTHPSLKPVVMMGHLDVVPVIEKNLPEWKVAPFGGEIKNDTIWGRGAIDDKVGVIGIMEAVELLLKQGYTPKRSFYFAFGHDEEIGGRQGAVAMATYLKEKGVKAEFVVDEGGVIADGLVPDITKEVALIGTAEKGYLTLNLAVKIEGGHSSMPGKETAIDVMSTAIAKLKNNPLPAKITVPLEGFMNYLGPEMPFINKMIFANKGLLEPFVLNLYEKSPSGNALIRTTTSPTIFNSGIKDNIIPQRAYATVNFRVLPETTIEDVIAHVKNVIDDDRITLTKGSTAAEASKLSRTDSFGFSTLNKTILELYPEVLVSPNLVVGATDSRHFRDISDDIYRFSPIHLNNDTKKSFHGLNERLAVEDFYDSIRFYIQFIKNSDQPNN
jgi:carboxypeptidase PM20D1